jgi:hypothetical protein
MNDPGSWLSSEEHESPLAGITDRRVANPFDVIDTASVQSFPASDPPAWATGQLYLAPPAELEAKEEDCETEPLERGDCRLTL